MMIVLAFIGIIVSNPLIFKTNEPSSITPQITEPIQQWYVDVQSFLNARIAYDSQHMANSKVPLTTRIVSITFLTLLALGVIDRFVLQKIIRRKL